MTEPTDNAGEQEGGAPPEAGLRAPHGPVLEAVEGPARMSRGRIVLQLVAFAIGLALLAFVLTLALSEENRPTLERLIHAPPGKLAALIGLTGAAIVINAVVFWVVLWPLRRLSLLEIVAVNTISTFLSLLPLKISVVVRVLIHHRRDGVPLRDIVSWFSAIGACGLAVLGPLFLVSLWRGQLDVWWWVFSLLGSGVATALAVPLGRLGGGRFPILHRLSLGADRIVRHAGVVATQYVLRLLDLATVAGRFWVGAAIIGLDLPLDQAVLLGTTYFLIGVVSPASAIGFAEIGTVVIGRVCGLEESQVAVIALSVTLANVGTSGVAAIPAFLWLRPDRILAGKRAGAG